MAMSVPCSWDPMVLLEEGDCFTDDGWGGVSHQPFPGHPHRHFGGTIAKGITELTKHQGLLSYLQSCKVFHQICSLYTMEEAPLSFH